MQTLYVIIGCDTDPDRTGLVNDISPGPLSWRGMTEGSLRLKDSVMDTTDDRGKEPVFTWLLRVDEQIRALYGSYSWVLENYGKLLGELEGTGDELGWHPHFWRLNDRSLNWSQDATDVEWQLNMLRQSHEAYMNVLPGRARSVRMGWDYHNNETFGTLEQLGVVVDFSAIPGLRTDRGSNRHQRENLFDWYETPRLPYVPSRSDYRRPARSGEDSCELIEAPNFTSSSFFWGLISGLQFARKTKDIMQLAQAIRRPTYWINITGRPKLFSPLLAQLKRDLSRSERVNGFFVTYFHPDELLDNRSSLYDLSSVRTNIQSILQLCRSKDIEVVFIPAREIPRLISFPP